MCAIKDSMLEVENPPKETKCEVCGAGLGRTDVYGRNLCDNCEEKLHG